jgi:DNA-binding NarL/FixJ family response regulator
MALGRPVTPIVLTPDVRSKLEAMTRSRSLPHSLVRRAKIVVMAADGLNNKGIAEKLGLSRDTVGKWRTRFLRQGP